jgi:hypothetical protein
MVVTQALGQATVPRTQKQPGLEREAAAGAQKFNLASKLTKMTVKDSANQSIGQIQDLLIDDSGQVQYVAIVVQGAAGATDRLQPRTPGARSDQPAARTQTEAAVQSGKVTLVPYEAVQFHAGDAEAQAYVLLSIDKDRFSQAPTFTVQQITTGQQAQWMTQVDTFFEREKSGAARPDLNNPNRTNPNRQNPNRNNPNNPNRPNRNDPDREDRNETERNDTLPERNE